MRLHGPSETERHGIATDTGEHADIRVSIEGEHFHLHSLVASTMCERFRRILCHATKIDGVFIINFTEKSLTAKGFRAVVDWMYTRSPPISMIDVIQKTDWKHQDGPFMALSYDIMRAADYFGLDEMLKAYSGYFTTMITNANAIENLKLYSAIPGLHAMRDFIVEYVVANSSALRECESWAQIKELPPEVLCLLVDGFGRHHGDTAYPA